MNRRQFLRVNGALATLPFLPSIAQGKEVKPPKRLVIMYIPNGIVRRCFFPGEADNDSPVFVGGFNADKTKNDRRTFNDPGIYPLELSSTMEPLREHIGDISLVTGLDRTYKNGQDVHAQGASCYLTSLSPEQAAVQGQKYPNGKSLDQVIGDKIGGGNSLKTLEISCNGFAAPKEDIYFNNISWYGPGKIAPSIKDPQKLYERLFMADSFRTHVEDVSSLMLADANDLKRKLGREDKDTLDTYFENVRNIEKRIAKQKAMIAGADIRIPKNEILPRGEYIKLQADLMLLAMQMGITDICTFMIGPERWDATLMYEGVFDKPVQHHNMTHNQKGDGYKELQKIDIFHMQQYAYVIRRMKELKEPDGSSLLDNSLVTYGAGLGDGATHQYYDLPLIVAGKAQNQIKQGRFVKCKSGTLNSNMWLTIAKLMGVEIDEYSDSNGVVSELWT